LKTLLLQRPLIAWSIVALLVPFASEAFAKTPPGVPCGVDPYPAFANDEARPNFEVWTDDELPSGWTPPACTNLHLNGPRLLIAVAGTFRTNSSSDALAARFAAISATKGVKYWSASDKDWRVLIEDAAALTADRQRRADFTVEELMSSQDLYFGQQDNRSSSFVVYRLRVSEITADRLSIAIENVSDARFFGISIFEPGDLQSFYILQRNSDGWAYYNLNIVTNVSIFGGAPKSSYVNRAMAFYRHFVGLPTDQEPPAAP